MRKFYAQNKLKQLNRSLGKVKVSEKKVTKSTENIEYLVAENFLCNFGAADAKTRRHRLHNQVLYTIKHTIKILKTIRYNGQKIISFSISMISFLLLKS